MDDKSICCKPAGPKYADQVWNINSQLYLFTVYYFFFFVLVKRGDMLIVVLYSETYTKLSLFPSVWVISNLWKFHTYYFCDFCFLLKVVSNMFLICHFKDNVSWFVLNILFMLKCKKYLHLSFFTFKDIFSFIFVLLTSRHWLCGISILVNNIIMQREAVKTFCQCCSDLPVWSKVDVCWIQYYHDVLSWSEACVHFS